MATRQIVIEVKGEGGQYNAEVQKIIDRNNQLNRSAIEGAQQAQTQFGKLTATISGLPNLLNQVAGAMGLAFSVGALIGFGRAAIDLAGKIDDLSKRTGFARQTLSGIKSAIEENGSSLEAFALAVTKAQRSLADVEGDGKKAAIALAAMGLNVKELVAATPEMFFEKFAQALSKVEDQNTKVAIATRVMGRAGAEQIPVILELSDKFTQLRNEGLSDATIKRIDAMGDAFTRWKNNLLFGAIAVIDVLNERLDKTIQQLRDTKLYFSRLGEAKPGALLGGMGEANLDQFIKPKPAIRGLLDLSDKDSEIKKAAQERLQFLEQLKDKLRAAQSGFEGLSDPQQAALTQLSELEEKTKKFNDPAMRNLLETIKLYTLATIDKNQADERQKRIVKDLTEAAKAYDEQKKEEMDLLHVEMALKQKSRDFELEKLRVSGAPEQVILQRQIELLQEQQRALENSPIAKDPGQILEIQQKTELAQIQLQKLGQVSINIGQTIAGAVGDAFEGVILGTRKLGDVGKGLFAALLRDVGQFFTQALLKKAGFEGLLLSNVNGFVPQLTSAIGSAAGGPGALPGSQIVGGGQGGGIFGSLIGSIGNLLGTGTGIGSSTIGSLGAAGLGGFGLSSLLGGSGLQHGLSTLGSIGGSLLGSIPLGTVGIGGSIYSGFSASGIIGDLASNIFGSTIGGAIGDFLLPGIGSIIGMLLGRLFQKIPDPSVWVQSIIKFYYDALTSSFGAFNQATIVKFKDISGGRAQQVLAEHQKILDAASKQFVDILNAFPTAVHAPIEAALADANKMLEILLGNKKYSDLGSRNIQQELADLQHHEAPAALFNSLREAIGIGFRETFKTVGFDFTDVISRQFGPLLPTLLQRPGGAGFFGGQVDQGLFADTDPDKRNAFFGALSKLAGFGGTLASISPRGVTPFLSDSDLIKLQGELQRVFESPTAGFATAVDDMIQRLQPLADFLKQSVTDATNIFSRGIIAAMDAATQSSAFSAFQQSLGAGLKEQIFNGITGAFVASAQFTDLLAPVQKIIRDFTNEALSTGETPDIAAFRRAIFPAIEDISSRAETLRPLIDELQKLGLDVNKILGILGLGGSSGDINITINGNVNDETDARDFARRIEAILRPALPPPT